MCLFNMAASSLLLLVSVVNLCSASIQIIPNSKGYQVCKIPACGGLRSKGFKKLIFSFYSIILEEVK